MSACTTRKRARTGSITATSSHDVAKDSGNPEDVARICDKEFWYGDGNIILVARDVEFRVYQGLLANHSPVFRDMFSLPQHPTASSPPADFCPVVHISDSPEDLRHVLRAYMPTGGPKAFFHKDPPYSYHAISAAVRLGHKYQMADLLDNALDHLKTYYPTDFDSWQLYETYGPPGFSAPRTHAIGVVNLARLTGENGLLLMALLVCCTIDDADIMARGFEREDGSREQLTLDDMARCYAAKPRLIAASVQIMLRICRPAGSLACTTVQRCSLAFKYLLSVLETSEDPIALAHVDPSMVAADLEDALSDSGLCVECRALVEERSIRERKAVWEQLEEIFGIELPKVDNE